MAMSTTAVTASRAVAPPPIRANASHMLPTPPPRLAGGEGVAEAPGVVDAEDVGAAGDGGQAGADGGVVARVGRLAGELAEEALARRAHHDRAPDGGSQLAGAREQH